MYKIIVYKFIVVIILLFGMFFILIQKGLDRFISVVCKYSDFSHLFPDYTQITDDKLEYAENTPIIFYFITYLYIKCSQ